MDKCTVGATIASLRKKNQLTQLQLAEKLYTTQSAISKWERGMALPDIDKLQKMALLFEVDISEFTHQDDDSASREQPTISSSAINPTSKRKLIFSTVFICIAATVLIFISIQNISQPTFKIVDEYYDSARTFFDYDTAYNVVVSYKGKINNDDVRNYIDLIKESHGNIEDADAVVIIFCPNLKERDNPLLSYSYLGCIPLTLSN